MRFVIAFSPFSFYLHMIRRAPLMVCHAGVFSLSVSRFILTAVVDKPKPMSYLLQHNP